MQIWILKHKSKDDIKMAKCGAYKKLGIFCLTDRNKKKMKCSLEEVTQTRIL